MLDAQGGVCAICGSPPPEGEVLRVDHDHVTGKVRGFLCIVCNAGVGCFKDNENLLLAAINYLRKTETVRV